MPASSRVFGVFELLEHILDFLAPRDLLRCHSVNTTFHDTIEGSRQLGRTLFWEVDHLQSGQQHSASKSEQERRVLAGGKDNLLELKSMRRSRNTPWINNHIEFLTYRFELPGFNTPAWYSTTDGKISNFGIRLKNVWDMFKLEADAASSFGRCYFTDPAEHMVVNIGFKCPLVGKVKGPRNRSRTGALRRWLGVSKRERDYSVSRYVLAKVETCPLRMGQAIEVCRVLIALYSKYGNVGLGDMAKIARDASGRHDFQADTWQEIALDTAQWRDDSEMHRRVADLLRGLISWRSCLCLED
ncbi:hypothetical protein HII31_06548 [Pseudocercospora fuligena]|uniref:F-box domain-containing protein n=1 Tax=Pseudocercospora fuligena TaxID=685502 RepID=A0A8H6VIZ6_9PEZI|nr:hypothetical protein HII31_06548 [Pseudocercospora fuligena]